MTHTLRCLVNKAYIALCDKLEYALSRWWGTGSYAATLAAAWWWFGWDTMDRWVYISNAMLVVMLIGNSRRSDRAMHIKLDDAAQHVPDQLEKRDETEMPQ